MDSRKVLIVEDDRGLRNGIEGVLSPYYKVVATDDLSRAVRSIGCGKYSCLVMDLYINGVNTGLEILDQIRKLDPSLPVVIITQNGSFHTAYNAIRNRVSAYLMKPFDIANLKKLVDVAVDNKGLGDSRPIRKVLYIDPTEDGKREVTQCLERERIQVNVCDDVLNGMMKTATEDYDMVIASQQQNLYSPTDIAGFMQDRRVPFVIVARNALSPVLHDTDTKTVIVSGPSRNNNFSEQIIKIAPAPGV